MADLDVVEREAREAREEAARLRARVAALEAVLRVLGSYDHSEDCAGRYDEHGDVPDEDEQDALCDCSTGEATRALSGGTQALDAVVSAAVAESRARTFRAAITYVTGDLRTPHPDADAEAKAFAAAVRERIAAAVAAERARIRARVEVMERQREGATSLGGDGLGTHPDGEWIWRDDVLSAIDATAGGAP